MSSEEIGRFSVHHHYQENQTQPYSIKGEGRLLHPARSLPRVGGMGERCSGQQQRSQQLSHALRNNHVGSTGQCAPSAWELLCEGWGTLFMGLLLPPTCISGQSNPCLNCSSAALLRESKDSLSEMDVVLPLGAAVVLLPPSVPHHSPTCIRRQEIYGRSQRFGALAPGMGTQRSPCSHLHGLLCQRMETL